MANNGKASLGKSSTARASATWLKNAIKSVGIAANLEFKSMAPSISSVTDSVSSGTASVLKTLSKGRSGGSAVINAIKDNKYVKIASNTFNQAIRDIKSGNIIKDTSTMEDTEYSLGDDGAETIQVQTDTSGLSDLAESMNKQTEAQIKAQKASMDAYIAVSSVSLQQSGKIGEEVRNQLANINNNLAALVQFNTDTMSKFVEASVGYYEATGKGKQEDSVGIDKQNIKSSDIFKDNYKGGIDINTYTQYMKQQFKKTLSQTEYGQIAAMLNDEAILKELQKNPIGVASSLFTGYMVPVTIRASLEGVERTFSNFLPTMLARLGDWGELKGNDIATKIKRFVGKAFGIQKDGGGNINNHKIERGPIPFDGETKTAITEIITKELREQTAYLEIIANHYSRNKARQQMQDNATAFNMSTGKWETRAETDKSIADTLLRAVQGAFDSSNFGKTLKGSIITARTTDTEKTLYTDALNELMMNIARAPRAELTLDNLLKMVDNSKRGNNTKNALKTALQSMAKNNPGAFNNITTLGITAGNAYTTAKDAMYNDNYGYNVQNSIFNGSNMRVNNDGTKEEKSTDETLDQVLGFNDYYSGGKKSDTKKRKDIKSQFGANGKFHESKVKFGQSAIDLMNAIMSGDKGRVIDQSAAIVTSVVKPITQKVSEAVFGKKDDGDQSTLKGQITNLLTDTKQKIMVSLFGEKSVDEDGNVIKTTEGLVDRAKASIAKGFSFWTDAFFGIDDIEDEEERDRLRKEALEEAQKKFKENLPNGLIGAGGGLLLHSLSGGLLGSLLGSSALSMALGAAVGFAAKNEKFQNYLFGEIDEDTGERKGGLISKNVQDWFKNNKETALISTGLGAMAGSLGLIPPGMGFLTQLVGGPIAGSLLGLAGGVALKSGMFNRFLFGDQEKGQLGLIGGINNAINKHFNKDKDSNSNVAGAAVGIAGGALAGKLVLGGSLIKAGGLMGALVSGPVVGSLLGLALSIKASEGSFREWLFGKKGGLDLGNGTKKDKAGILGRIGNSIDVNIIKPMKTELSYIGKDFMNVLEHRVLAPITYIGEAVTDYTLRAAKFIIKPVTSIVGAIGKSSKNLVGRIAHKSSEMLGSLMSKTTSLLYKATRRVISTPGALAEAIIKGLGVRDWINNLFPVKLVKSIVSDAKSLIFRTIRFAGRTLIGGIGNVLKHTAKGILAIPKAVGSLALALGKTILGKLGDSRVGRFVKRKLSGVADKARSVGKAFVEARGKREETLSQRIRRNKKEYKAKREEIEEQKKINKKHNKVAKLIEKRSKGQFHEDSTEARIWAQYNDPALLNKIRGISEYSIDEEYDQQKKKAEAEINGYGTHGLSDKQLARMDPSKLTDAARGNQILFGIRDAVMQIASNLGLKKGEKKKKFESVEDRVKREDREEAEAARKAEEEARQKEDGNDNPQEPKKRKRGERWKFDKNKGWGENIWNISTSWTSRAKGDKATAYVRTDEDDGCYYMLNEDGKSYNQYTYEGDLQESEINDERVQSLQKVTIFRDKETGKMVYHPYGRVASWLKKKAVRSYGDFPDKSKVRETWTDHKQKKAKSHDGNAKMYRHTAKYVNKELDTMRRYQDDTEWAEHKFNIAGGGSDAGKKRGERVDRAKVRHDKSMQKAENKIRKKLEKEAAKEAKKEAIAKYGSTDHPDFEQGYQEIYERILQKKWDDFESTRDDIILDRAANNDKMAQQARDTGVPTHGLGGIVKKGLALVGEKGAELVKFKGGERVFNHRESSKMLDDMAEDKVDDSKKSRLATVQEENAKDQMEAVDTAKKQSEEKKKQLEEKKEAEKESKTQKFRDTVVEKVNGVKSGILEHTKNFLSSFGIKNGLFTVGVLGVLGWIKTKFPKVFNWLKNTLGSLLKYAGKFVGESLKDVADRVIDPSLNEDNRSIIDNATAEVDNIKHGNLLDFTDDGETGSQTSARINFVRGKTRRLRNSWKTRNVKHWYDSPKTRRQKTIMRKAEKIGKKVVEKGKKGVQKTASVVKKGATAVAENVKNSRLGQTVANTTSNIKNTKIVKNVGEKLAKVSDDASGLLNKLLKYIDDFLKFISKVASEKLGKKVAPTLFNKCGTSVIKKALQKVKNNKLTALIKKALSKIAGVVTKSAAKAAAGTATLGLSYLVSFGISAAEGYSGTAKLFMVSPDQVDGKMKLISTIFGVLEGTAIGGTIAIVAELLQSVIGMNIFTNVATVLYNWLAGEDKGKKLQEAQANWEQEYKDETDKLNRQQYETQKKAGLIPPDLTYDQFLEGVAEGIYHVDHKSFDDWNASKNKSLMDKAGSAIGKGFKHVKRFFAGKTQYTDENGNVYTENMDGTYQVKDADGNNLGSVSKDAIPENATKKKTGGIFRGIGKAVVGVGKGIGKAVVGVGKGIGKLAKGVTGLYRKAGGAVGSAIKDSASKFGKGMKEGWENLKKGNILGAYKSGVKAVANVALTPAKAVFNFISKKSKKAYLSSDGSYYIANANGFDYYSAHGDLIQQNCDAEKVTEMIKSGELKEGEVKVDNAVGKLAKKLRDKISSSWKEGTKKAAKLIKSLAHGAASILAKGAKKAGSIAKFVKGIFVSKKEEAWYDQNGCYYVYDEKGEVYTKYNPNGDIMEEKIPRDKVDLLIEAGTLTKGEIVKDSPAKKTVATITDKIKNFWSKAGDKAKSLWDKAKGIFGFGDGSSTSSSGGNGGFGTYFSQNDPRWKDMSYNMGSDDATMGEAGCGPTAMAMAMSDVTGRRVSPMQMADVAKMTGNRDSSGTNWNFVNTASNMMGVNTTQVIQPSSYDLESELRSGRPVILSGQSSSAGVPFTSAGHYVVARGIDENGNAIIDDPRGASYSHSYNISKLAGATKSSWIIGGSGPEENLLPTPSVSTSTYNKTNEKAKLKTAEQSKLPIPESMGSLAPISVPEATNKSTFVDPAQFTPSSQTTKGKKTILTYNGDAAKALSGNDICSTYTVTRTYDEKGNAVYKNPKMYDDRGNRLNKVTKANKTRGSENTLDVDRWISIIREVKRQMAEKKMGYDQGKTTEITIGDKTITMRTDCSGFTSTCLKFFGVVPEDVNLTSTQFADQNNSTMKNSGFTVEGWPGWDGLREGDIIAKVGHVEIFAYNKDGSHYVYNVGGNDSANSADPTKSAKSEYTTVWLPGRAGDGCIVASDTSGDATVNSDASSGEDIFSKIGSLFSAVAGGLTNAVLTGEKQDYNALIASAMSSSSSEDGTTDNGTVTTGDLPSTTYQTTSIGTADQEGGPSEKKGQTVTLPANLGTSNTFMGWQLITSPSSSQYKLREKAGQNFDENGYGHINGRYTVATTSTYGKVGDYLDITRKSGKVLPAIIADIKSFGDKGCNKYGHENGKSVTEFVVNKDVWYPKDSSGRMKGQDIGHNIYPGSDNSEVLSVTNRGNYFNDPNVDNKTTGGKGGFGAGLSRKNRDRINKAISYANKNNAKVGGYGYKSGRVKYYGGYGPTMTSAYTMGATSSIENMMVTIVELLSAISGSTYDASTKLALLENLKNNSGSVQPIINQNTIAVPGQQQQVVPMPTFVNKKAQTARAIAKGGY